MYSPSTCDCIFGFYDDSTKTNINEYCQPCDDFCSTCVTTATYCTACLPNNPGIIRNYEKFSCTCSAPMYFIINDPSLNKKVCITCHPICDVCTGPSADQCSSCSIASGSIFVAPSSCVCPSKTYYDYGISKCKKCSILCNECSGASNSECLGGCSPTGLSVENSPSTCVIDCMTMLEGYYKQGMTCKSKIFFILKNKKNRMQ